MLKVKLGGSSIGLRGVGNRLGLKMRDRGGI
jgi:hypothetical protein